MKIAIIRLKGRVAVDGDVESTLQMLNLGKKHACVVLEETPSVHGMLLKVKDHVTWGNIDADTLKLLESKRKEGKKAVFLHPPVGGYESKGTKKSFAVGGAAGPRKDDINDLLKRMLK